MRSPLTGGAIRAFHDQAEQERQVVEEVLEFGRTYGFGLEAGSEAGTARRRGDRVETTRPSSATGFKDAEFIEIAMMAHKIGRHITPVVEKYTPSLETESSKSAEKLGCGPASACA